MRHSPLLWLLLLGCLAAVTLVVVQGPILPQAPPENGPLPPELEQTRRAADLGPAESRSATHAKSSQVRGEQPTPHPGLQQTAPIPAQPTQVQQRPKGTTEPAMAQPVVHPQPPSGSAQPSDRAAEIWSYTPLLQQNATTNFIRAMEKLANGNTELDRYLVLNKAAKLSFVFGKTEEARSYANELLSLDQKFQAEPWRDGTAVHDGNLVLGRIALQEGRIDDAKQYLMEAGKSSGSPALGSFGPNMSLARDLLQRGERETACQYFDLCRGFWGMGSEKLTQWTADVQAGRIPDFGANLMY